MGDWQLHLKAAKSLIPPLVEGWATVRKSNRITPSVWSTLDGSQFNDTRDEESLSFENTGTLQFLTNVLAMYGIFSCISIGPSSSYADYRHLMDQPGLIQMEQIMGCKNWVMEAILEVGMLDRWKREEQEHRRLSLKALAKRALAIEDLIESGLKETIGIGLVDRITNIYATSALTYMHTVVSGLNPNLTEVQDSVSTTIVLINRLSDNQIIQKLIWPLTITGCMATRNQEDVFRTLINISGTTSSGWRNCWGMLKIWEGAWKMRDTPGQPFLTWEDFINNQSPPMLLVWGIAKAGMSMNGS